MMAEAWVLRPDSRHWSPDSIFPAQESFSPFLCVLSDLRGKLRLTAVRVVKKLK